MSARVGPSARPRTLKRRKPSLAARLRPFWIIFLVLAAAAGWGGFALAQSPWFRVVRVGIDVPIGSPVSREQVRRVAGIVPGANIWLLHTHAIARRLEAIPYVEHATIHRGQFPQPFVELGVSVRRPTACVRGGAGEVTIDATSRVLQNGCALPSVARIDAGRDHLPAPGAVITDPDVGRLLADAKVLADASLSLRSLGRDRWGGLEAVDVTGVRVLFGDDGDLAKKAALVEPVRAGVKPPRPLRAIDLRAPSSPTVVFR